MASWSISPYASSLASVNSKSSPVLSVLRCSSNFGSIWPFPIKEYQRITSPGFFNNFTFRVVAFQYITKRNYCVFCDLHSY